MSKPSCGRDHSDADHTDVNRLLRHRAMVLVGTVTAVVVLLLLMALR